MPLEDLLRACAEGGDGEAWREFIALFGGLIGGVVLKTARRWGETSTETISDLIQECDALAREAGMGRWGSATGLGVDGFGRRKTQGFRLLPGTR